MEGKYINFTFIVGREKEIAKCIKSISINKGDYIFMPYNWQLKKHFGTRSFIVEDIAHQIPQGNLTTIYYDDILVYLKPVNPMQKANKQTAAVFFFFLIGIPLLVWVVDSVGEWMAK